MKNPFYKLTLVTNKHHKPLGEYLQFIDLCINAGITCVQLREKHLPYSDLLEFGKQLQTILRPFNIPLIVNDNVQLALELEAAGVHLGQADDNVIDARKRLGKSKLIGLTIDSVAQLHIANTLPINYIGIGAIFPTRNKINITTVWGCERLKLIVLLSKYPTVAIGGINLSNALEVMRSGVDGIAAIAAFHEAKYPKIVIRNLRHIVDKANHA